MSNAARIARRIAAKRPQVTVKESGPGCEVGLLDQRGRRVPDAYLVGTIGARDDVVSSLLDQNQLDPDGEVGEYLSSFVRERRGTVASIDWMSVPEGMRRRGLGSAMVGAFLARAKAKGAKSVYVLASSPDETDAPAFYESLGFGLEGSFGEGEMMRLSFGVASAEAGGEHPAKRGARCGNARTANVSCQAARIRARAAPDGLP